MKVTPERTAAFLGQRLDAARDLYLLALAMGERGGSGGGGGGGGGPHPFGTLIQEARLHFINVIEEARAAGLDTIDIQNMLASHDVAVDETIRPDLRERLEELLRMHANPR